MDKGILLATKTLVESIRHYILDRVAYFPYVTLARTPRSNVTRMCKISEKRGKNKGKLYTKECGLNKITKSKKTPENIW